MGAISEVLSSAELPDHGVCGTRLVIEACESIHVHYRDLRIELSPSEFAAFAAAHNRALQAWAGMNVPQDAQAFHELDRHELEAPVHAPRLLTVELLRDGTLHVHYRNVRLEMSAETAACFAQTLLSAYSRLVTRGYDESGGHSTEAATLSMDEVNQFDQGHRRNPNAPYGFDCRTSAETEDHERGIRLCMRLIEAGYEFLPIAVTLIDQRDIDFSGPVSKSHRYQRLDGFKRYEAMRRLGAKRSVCHVYTGAGAVPGVQRYLPWVIGRRQTRLATHDHD